MIISEKIIKRLIDIFISMILLLIFLPLMIITSIWIKLDSKGPIIFKQKRVGLNNKLFNIFKFRTMYVETPNLATDKLSNSESYITKIGMILRKTSLDELPQLINVIKGDMSLVGPRPALYNQYDLIKIRTNRGVHEFRPGITGLAQVNGRDELSINDKVKFDYIYISEFSLIMDFKILLMTVFKVLRKDGVKEASMDYNQSVKKG